jgi:hypothetical protein
LVYDKIVKKILFSLIFLAVFFSLFLSKAYAGGKCGPNDPSATNPCCISWQSPDPMTIAYSTVNLNIEVSSSITSPGPDDHAQVTLTGPDNKENNYTGDCAFSNPDNLTIAQDGSNGSIPIRTMWRNGIHTNWCTEGANAYPPGTYTLKVYNGWGDRGTPICTASFDVPKDTKVKTNFCTPSFDPNDPNLWTPQQQPPIKFKATNFSGGYNNSCLMVRIVNAKYNKDNGWYDEGSEVTEYQKSPTEISSGIPLPGLSIGDYLAIVMDKCDSGTTWDQWWEMCSAVINIQPVKPTPTGGPAPAPPTCIHSGYVGCNTTTADDTLGNCCTKVTDPTQTTDLACIGPKGSDQTIKEGLCEPSGSLNGTPPEVNDVWATDINTNPPPDVCDPSTATCNTAVGAISTSAQGFVNSLMAVILSIVGGIAVILIIISGYRLMVSQGNPENIKNAKDQLTAAIVGLLFVIFSLVILQIIGVNILGLPGFAPSP